MNLSRKIALTGVAGGVLLAWLAASRFGFLGSGAAPGKPSAWRQGAPTNTVTDSEEIFKRAFWRRPGKDDEILHAERHEWRDGDGLQRWQWFLVVKASPQLIKDLRDDNAFGLVPGAAGSLNPEAPSWFVFKPDEFSIFQSPHAGMRLMFSSRAIWLSLRRSPGLYLPARMSADSMRTTWARKVGGALGRVAGEAVPGSIFSTPGPLLAARRRIALPLSNAEFSFRATWREETYAWGLNHRPRVERAVFRLSGFLPYPVCLPRDSLRSLFPNCILYSEILAAGRGGV